MTVRATTGQQQVEQLAGIRQELRNLDERLRDLVDALRQLAGAFDRQP